MIPVNADVGEVHIIMVPEEDRLINPIGVKGIGEIRHCRDFGGARQCDLAMLLANALRDLPLRD